jgi:NtrC-family two-component system response regulator AlgB
MGKDTDKRLPAQGLRVLVIDDEKNIRTALTLCLEEIGCFVAAVASAQAAIDTVARQRYELVFLDVRLNRSSGLDLIPRLLAESPDTMIIVMTAYATIDNAVEAMKRGAADYLAKPFSPAQIRHAVDRCLSRRDLTRHIRDLEFRLREAVPEIDLDSDSPKLRSVIDTEIL